MTIELMSFGTLTIKMRAPQILAGTPAGTRVVVEFTAVRLESPRLVAERQGATAGDWLIVGPEGTATLDMRFVLQTAEGSLLYMHGPGVTESAGFAQGSPVWFYPRVETADPKLAWLHRTPLVARGKSSGDTVVFELAELR
jgi:hypothetical protein